MATLLFAGLDRRHHPPTRLSFVPKTMSAPVNSGCELSKRMAELTKKIKDIPQSSSGESACVMYCGGQGKGAGPLLATLIRTSAVVSQKN